ncbi:Sec-independent protein translocase subunit TatA [Leucobacter sp. OH1287]|uniref:Sec-independent protein translocase subunit TatA n=1 Tax=Leucobacter sp. OH1287 TaxID=2491049 RepID=UPI000F5E6E51|nr:Sec-independent protein translocase subunit TatA [Leucobacter sp. OH1287]RRD61293.1 twin-arginine translocase TatA/TatE family subunit [Leucobacter sp. OH1287]
MPWGNIGGWHFLIILLVILLLFGAPKLPQLAKSLGQSAKILKKEVSDLTDDKDAGQQVNNAAQDGTVQNNPVQNNVVQNNSAQNNAAPNNAAQQPTQQGGSDNNAA